MDEAGGLLRARSVSFSPARDHIQPECAQGVDSSQDLRRSPSAGIPKKSAMKQGNQMRLPPAAWYQHPDPLVRRLRLVDGHGKHVNLKQEFRDVKLVLFYFGSQWSVQNSKKCSSVVYVSVDMEERFYEAATRNRPWLSMEWNDGSSGNPEDPNDNPEGAMPQRESFLLAEDEDLDANVVAADTAGTSYVRPFSRVYMAFKLNILMTPTLAVYNTQTHCFLDTNVRLSRLRSMQVQATMDTWLRGEPSPSINLTDIVYIAPWTTIMILGAILYCLLRVVGGEQMSISNLVNRFT